MKTQLTQEQKIMRRWWEHMADLMETQPDGSPKTDPLKLVFHMN